MTLKNLIFLVILAAGGYYAYTVYGPKELTVPTMDPYQKGFLQLESFQYDAAIDTLRAAIKEKPGDPREPEAEFMIASALEKDKKLPEARAAFLEFLQRHPDHERAHTAKDRAEKLALLK
jgi:outer membrane protein assembly factor BamD (BamD/ComL family)